jgi:hypothetical protein
MNKQTYKYELDSLAETNLYLRHLLLWNFAQAYSLPIPSAAA